MKIKFTTIAFVLLLLIQNLQAQTEKPISTESEEYTIPLHTGKKTFFYKLSFPLTEKEIQHLDILSADERHLIINTVNPIAVGIVRNLKSPVNFDLKNVQIPLHGEVSTAGGRLSRINKDTVVFTTAFRSENSDQVRLYFEKGLFPNGVQVNLFGRDNYAFTQQALNGKIDKEGFYTTTTFSDYVTVQVVIPLVVKIPEVHFTISKITHVENKDIPGHNNRPTADCYRDANCIAPQIFQHIDNLQKAVAALYFVNNNQLVFFCSGALINDNRTTDFQPFLLTANHCLSTQANANTVEAHFSYWTTTCNSNQINQNIIVTNGTNLIRTSSQSDFTLLLLKEKPSGSRTYLGWTTAPVPDNESLRSVHHPEGTFQKYSRHQNKTSPDYICRDLVTGTDITTTHHHYTKTLNGQINGGSSGAPLMNESGQIVGQLRGTCPGNSNMCNYNSYYNAWGKFSSSYTNNTLQAWLYNNAATVSGSIGPSSLNYGTLSVGQSTSRNVTVDNTGTRPNYLNLEAGPAIITGSGANQFSISGSNELYLSPGRQSDLTINFTPSSPGSHSAILRISHNANNIGASPRQITLYGCAAPLQPSLINGASTVSKLLEYTYTIPPVPGALSYTWTYNGEVLMCTGTSCTVTPAADGVLSVTANVSCASSLPTEKNITVNEGIRIFPNPVINEIMIEYGGNTSPVNFEVYNALGQIVYRGSIINRTKVSTQFLSSGVYFIKFHNGEKSEIKRIIKTAY